MRHSWTHTIRVPSPHIKAYAVFFFQKSLGLFLPVLEEMACATISSFKESHKRVARFMFGVSYVLVGTEAIVE